MRLLLLAGLLSLGGCSTVTGWFSDDEEKEESLLSGERISVLAEEKGLAPSESLKDADVTLPDAVAPNVWPQTGATATHYFPNVTATLAEERDSGSAGSGHAWPGALMAAPVVGATAVFAMDGDGEVSAHVRTRPSDVLWSNDSLLMEEEGYGGGLATQGEMLYAVTPEGRVAAISAATGKTIWMRELHSPVRAAPRLFEDMLLISTVDSQLFALTAADGGIRWQHRGISEAASMLGSSLPAAAGPLIIVAYNSGELYALSRRNGEPVWNESLLLPTRTRASDSFTGISGDPVIAGGYVYGVSTNGLLAALDLRTGLRVWEQKLASSQTPWVTPDFLFMLGADRRLTALSTRGGEVKWTTRLEAEEQDEDEAPLPLHGPYLVNGQLLVIDPAGFAILVDPKDGKVIDRRDFVAGVTASPAFADGGLYVLDQDSVLHFVK
jgi:outer membrane protein assembly factor BamB